MTKVWIIAIVTFLVIAFLIRRILIGYVIRNYGDDWLNSWGNKVYFWQSIIFTSTAGTWLTLYLLKSSGWV